MPPLTDILADPLVEVLQNTPITVSVLVGRALGGMLGGVATVASMLVADEEGQ